MNFNDFNWHDSILKDISIDRSRPGIHDDIKFKIESVEGEDFELVFENTYWAKMILNFGIVADETILDACICDNNDVDLVDLYLKWRNVLDGLNLNMYQIELNSTGGIIKIISQKINITKIHDS